MMWWPRRKPKMILCLRKDCMNHLEHSEGEHMLEDISEITQRVRREADKAIAANSPVYPAQVDYIGVPQKNPGGIDFL